VDQYNKKHELLALRAILDGPENISLYLLGELKATIIGGYRGVDNQDGHFGWEAANDIYARILVLLSNGKEIPSSTVLTIDQSLSQSARIFLKTKCKIITTKNEATYIVSTLEQYRKIRITYRGLQRTINLLKNTEDPTKIEDALLGIEDTIIQARSKESINFLRFGQESNNQKLCDEILDKQKANTKILTGFEEFDHRTGGFARSNLVIIAGPTSGGKSVMAVQFCVNMFRDFHYNVSYISFEMSKPEVMGRILANISSVPYKVIDMKKANPRQQNTVKASLDNFNIQGIDHKNRLDVWCPEGDYTANEIASKLRPYNYDVIIVDYIGLIAHENTYKGGQTEATSLASIAKTFKIVANQLNAVIILLAQWDTDKNHIRYSRAIQEHANFLWKWAIDTADEDDLVMIHQDKARNSERYGFNLRPHFKVMRWENSPDFDPRDYPINNMEDELGEMDEGEEVEKGSKKVKNKASTPPKKLPAAKKNRYKRKPQMTGLGNNNTLEDFMRED